MNHSFDKLEIGIYQLAQKFGTLIGENSRLDEEITRLKFEQEKQKAAHENAVDEPSEALLVQVGKLKGGLRGKIDQLNVEKDQYRSALAQNTVQIHRLLACLPKEEQPQ